MNNMLNIMVENGTLQFFSTKLGLEKCPEVFYSDNTEIVTAWHNSIIFNDEKLKSMQLHYAKLNSDRHIPQDMTKCILVWGCILVLEQESGKEFTKDEKIAKMLSVCGGTTKIIAKYIIARAYGKSYSDTENVRQEMFDAYTFTVPKWFKK